jgi:hypothetical protein
MVSIVFFFFLHRDLIEARRRTTWTTSVYQVTNFALNWLLTAKPLVATVGAKDENSTVEAGLQMSCLARLMQAVIYGAEWILFSWF